MEQAVGKAHIPGRAVLVSGLVTAAIVAVGVTLAGRADARGTDGGS
ncbi:hypothetical protein ACWC0A_17750 [Streptomyces scopuliridis]